jgi:hypothetical protein
MPWLNLILAISNLPIRFVPACSTCGHSTAVKALNGGFRRRQGCGVWRSRYPTSDFGGLVAGDTLVASTNSQAKTQRSLCQAGRPLVGWCSLFLSVISLFYIIVPIQRHLSHSLPSLSTNLCSTAHSPINCIIQGLQTNTATILGTPAAVGKSLKVVWASDHYRNPDTKQRSNEAQHFEGGLVTDNRLFYPPRMVCECNKVDFLSTHPSFLSFSFPTLFQTTNCMTSCDPTTAAKCALGVIVKQSRQADTARRRNHVLASSYCPRSTLQLSDISHHMSISFYLSHYFSTGSVLPAVDLYIACSSRGA